MRIALFSDVHANPAALEAVLAEIENARVDLRVCLGDIVGYNAQPNEALALVRQHADIVVAGNHDRDVFRQATAGTRSSARLSQQWSASALDADERAFLEQLPAHVVHGSFVAAHGAYLSEIYVSGYVTSTMLEENLRAIDARAHFPQLAFCGHTHVPMMGTWDGVVCEESSLRSPQAWNARARAVLVNPGSVGQPRDGDPRASFAIVDIDERRCQVVRVPYDIDRTVAAMCRANFPDELTARLREGR